MVTITIKVKIIVTAIVTIIVSNNCTTKMALLAAFVSINIYHRILFLTF